MLFTLPFAQGEIPFRASTHDGIGIATDADLKLPVFEDVPPLKNKVPDPLIGRK